MVIFRGLENILLIFCGLNGIFVILKVFAVVVGVFGAFWSFTKVLRYFGHSWRILVILTVLSGRFRGFYCIYLFFDSFIILMVQINFF